MSEGIRGPVEKPAQAEAGWGLKRVLPQHAKCKLTPLTGHARRIAPRHAGGARGGEGSRV